MFLFEYFSSNYYLNKNFQNIKYGTKLKTSITICIIWKNIYGTSNIRKKWSKLFMTFKIVVEKAFKNQKKCWIFPNVIGGMGCVTFSHAREKNLLIRKILTLELFQQYAGFSLVVVKSYRTLSQIKYFENYKTFFPRTRTHAHTHVHENIGQGATLTIVYYKIIF